MAITAAITAVTAVVSVAIGYFQTKKAIDDLKKIGTVGVSAQKRGYEINTRSSVANRSVIYGETKVGGIVVFDHSYAADNNKFNRVIALAGHEVDSIQKVFLDLGDYSYRVSSISGDVTTLTKQDFQYNDIAGDTLSTSGKIGVKAVAGGHTLSLDGAAPPNFDTSVWTANHKLLGVAHVAASFVYDEDLFPQGVPTVTALVRGKKLYDPRTTTTAWSDNPALAILDYLRDTKYGVGVSDSNIDFTSFSNAANVCDQLVDGAKRYTVNGFFLTSQAHIDVLDQLRSSMAGHLWYSQGKWRVKAGSYVAPTLTLTEDDLRSPVSVSTRVSRRDSANTVKGVFSGKASGYKETEYPPVTAPAFVTQDNGYENILDLSFPFTDTADEAQRLAIIALEKSRLQTTVSATFGIRAFGLQIGDVVQLTNTRLGFSNKTFEVSDWSFGLGEDGSFNVDLVLRETTAGVFNSTLDINPYNPGETNLPDSLNLTITGLAVAAHNEVGDQGVNLHYKTISWNAPVSIVGHYEVRYKVSGINSWTTMVVPASDTEATIGPLLPGVSINISVRAVSNSGIKGPEATTTATVEGDATPPTGSGGQLGAVGGFRKITLTWEVILANNVAFTEVWRSATGGVGSYVKIASVKGSGYVDSGLGLGEQWYYQIRHVSNAGVPSDWSFVRNATTTWLDDPDFEDGIRSLFTDQDLFAIRSVATLPAQGEFVGDKRFNTTDGFLYEWNGSSWTQKPGIIQTGLLAASGVITDAAQINDAVITNAKIDNLAVDTLKIADNAVSTVSFFSQTVANVPTTGLTSTSQLLTGTGADVGVANWTIIALSTPEVPTTNTANNQRLDCTLQVNLNGAGWTTVDTQVSKGRAITGSTALTWKGTQADTTHTMQVRVTSVYDAQGGNKANIDHAIMMIKTLK